MQYGIKIIKMTAAMTFSTQGCTDINTFTYAITLTLLFYHFILFYYLFILLFYFILLFCHVSECTEGRFALNKIVLFYLYYKLLGLRCKTAKFATMLQNEHCNADN